MCLPFFFILTRLWNDVAFSVFFLVSFLLDRLDLGANFLQGTIPTELGLLTSIDTLKLEINSLTGSIPSELGNAANLSTYGNQTCSVSFWSLFCDYHSSRLSSKRDIPRAIPSHKPWSLSSFLTHTHTHTHICTAQLEIGTNQLTGTMPTELGKLTLMKDLEVQNNTLTGPIPSEIGLMTSLGKFVLNRNGKDVLPCGVLSQTIGRIHKY